MAFAYCDPGTGAVKQVWVWEREVEAKGGEERGEGREDGGWRSNVAETTEERLSRSWWNLFYVWRLVSYYSHTQTHASFD